MQRHVLGFWLAGRGTLHRWHGNNIDQYQRVLESGIGALTFCPCLDIFSIAPMERYACVHGWQHGGGLYIAGNATLTNTNVYEKCHEQECYEQARQVCLPFQHSLNLLSFSAPLVC